MDLSNSHTSDEEDSCGDDEISGGRRRRFCIERKQQQQQQLLPGGSKPRKSKIDPRQNRINYESSHSNKRRKVCEISRPPKAIITNACEQPNTREKLPGTVIFINPKFVKKFIEKSIRLAASNPNNTTNSSNAIENKVDASTATTSVKNCMIEDIDFKTSPKEALRAASTMAIIRIVTECIEDDNKRDEKLNKTLVSRLIERLTRHGDPPDADEKSQEKTKSHSSSNINNDSTSSNRYDSEISESRELGTCGGRPIPVIGGSVTHHYSKNVKSTYYSPVKRTHNPHQRPRRIANDRNNEGHAEYQKNKLKNYS